jgi:adenylosuccinate synthase
VAIARYYEDKTGNDQLSDQLDEELDAFLEHIQAILPHIRVVQEKTFFRNIIKTDTYDHLVFEGSQGILLDMDHGFFPNVTRAHTTSRNAIDIIQRNVLGRPEVYYVSRAYQTRHGNGYLSNENLVLDITPNPEETITCMDQLNGPIQATIDGLSLNFESTMELLGHLDVSVRSLVESHSDCARDMRVRKRKWSKA